ncbi:MAG: hypothetical protein ABL970_07415 [Nitrospira sp.]
METYTIEAIVERTSRSLDAIGAELPVYGVARVLGACAGNHRINGASHVLAVVDAPQSAQVALYESQCIPVPNSLGSDEALRALPLAMALYVWDRLQLELGEAAVYTEGDCFTDLVGQVAIWRGGCPVIRLGIDSGRASLSMEEQQLMSDQEEALRQLRKRIQDKPGFAAVDLSGRPETIDLLLEVAPQWGRVMLAGRTRQPLTVDFYNNVHRKGVLLLSGIFDPASVFHHAGSAAYLPTAFRILQNKEMAAICSQLVPVKLSL